MRNELLRIFANWEIELKENEWYFSDCYEELTKELSSSDAFAAILDVIDVLLLIKEAYLLNETLEFLGIIYNIADTTEIHPMLLVQWENITRHIQWFGDSYSYSAWKDIQYMVRIAELP
ncbi:ABC transporter [Terribacillus saccharophilus]|uniref:ABC transporter n=1 Tax=Terribacillus saccharophilus TaxID=361277 RepID=UPI002DC75577|nr:ABC transporter [Terribacillus saccharophilus]